MIVCLHQAAFAARLGNVRTVNWVYNMRPLERRSGLCREWKGTDDESGEFEARHASQREANCAAEHVPGLGGGKFSGGAGLGWTGERGDDRERGNDFTECCNARCAQLRARR